MELQRQADKLASISQLTKKRIDASIAKINDIREQLQGFVVNTRVSSISADNLMMFMVKQLFLSQLAMTHSETFCYGIDRCRKRNPGPRNCHSTPIIQNNQGNR